LPGFDERLKQYLERAAPPADPSGAFDRVLERKIRRRLIRRFQAAGLAVVVVSATVGGTFALVRAFRSSGTTERLGGIEPTPGPAKNGLIAYTSNQSGNLDIWTAQADGTQADNLTPDSLSSDFNPAWSPDGSKIAFVSERNSNEDIYVMSAQGAGVMQLTHDASSDEFPAWSPDGTKIAYVSNNDMFVVESDGSSATRLTSTPEQESHPTWAPDGSRVAFARLRYDDSLVGPVSPPSGQIYVMNPDGSGVTRLTRGPPVGADDWPDWSPDGTTILFSRGPNLYVMDVDGGALHRITNDHHGASPSARAAWSPDGRKIVFEHSSAGEALSAIYVMRADGSHLASTGLTPGAGVIGPDWQPIVLPESPVPSVSPEPSPTPSTSPFPAKCNASQVTGDFDGDGQPDTATVAKTECFPREPGAGKKTSYSLQVGWPPTEGLVPLPDCANACQALAATDLNLDGIDEFILKVDQGSSSFIIEVYELPATEAFGDPARTAPPGAPGFPPDQAAQFSVGGSVSAFAALGCMPGNNEIIVEIAKLDSKQTEYTVHETVLRFDPIDNPPFGQFTVTSTEDRTEPYDNEVGPGDRFEPGGPCWMD